MHDLRVPTKQILVTLPVDLHKKMSIYCIENDLKKSAFIRQLINEKIGSNKELEESTQHDIEVDELLS
jgi:hypothetical protein